MVNGGENLTAFFKHQSKDLAYAPSFPADLGVNPKTALQSVEYYSLTRAMPLVWGQGSFSAVMEVVRR
jgi:hypothetical protein